MGITCNFINLFKSGHMTINFIFRDKYAFLFKQSLIIGFILLIIKTNAQNLLWVKKVGTASEDIAYAMTLDPEGNVICAGNYWGTADFDPGAGVFNLGQTGSSNRDIFIAKYDNSGVFIWAKKIGAFGPDHAHGITTDTSGNIYTTGFFNSNNCDFDPGMGTYTMSTNGGTNGDIFISKLDKDGNFLWARRIGGTTNDFAYSISVDENQNSYITGSFSGTWDFDPTAGVYNLTANGTDIFVLKLDINGNFIWAVNIDVGITDAAKGVKVDGLNNVYITGQINISSGVNHAYVAKISSAGNIIWERQTEGTNSAVGQYITVDKTGNVYSTGYFNGVGDFDPDITSTYTLSAGVYNSPYVWKLDSTGKFIWVKNFANTTAYPTSITLDRFGNVYSSGYFNGTIDMDPSSQIKNLSSIASSNGYFSVLSPDGNYIGSNAIYCKNFASIYSVDVDEAGKVFVAGSFSDTLKTLQSSIPNLPSSGSDDIFIAKFSQKGVSGYVYNDINQNCTKENNEMGLKLRRAIINPGNIIVETDINGRWLVDSLPVGNYSVCYDVPNGWMATCSNTLSFSVTNSNNFLVAPDFGLVSTSPCPQPEISVIASSLRRCFSNQKIHVKTCNLPTGTGAIINPYVVVTLDTLLSIDSASISFTSLMNNRYRFQLPNLNPDICEEFLIYSKLSCNATLGRTLCMKAELFPIDTCVLDTVRATTLPLGSGTTSVCASQWDHSSLSVSGYCQNDTVYFTITNNGSPVSGNMLCSSPVRVYVDGVLTHFYSIMLSGGQSVTYTYTGSGQAWVLQADQHPLHPGNSHPAAHVEACGSYTNWASNFINILPLNDADPIIDEYCGLVTGSYDPNDKTGYPLGLGVSNDILPNQQLQYVIRFQNTGTDTAITVVIRDTLDIDLNIFSVVSGVSSHDYSFRMFGPRVLEWTFDNIMLPDSAADESGSHGFVTYRVDQNINLPNGTTIFNDADIYFDFNSPVITNQTVHTINNQINNVVTTVKQENGRFNFIIYPNPVSHVLNIRMTEDLVNTSFVIRNQLGQMILCGNLKNANSEINLDFLASGFYIFSLEHNHVIQSIKLIKE